jgi:hypothetical protein
LLTHSLRVNEVLVRYFAAEAAAKKKRPTKGREGICGAANSILAWVVKKEKLL